MVRENAQDKIRQSIKTRSIRFVFQNLEEIIEVSDTELTEVYKNPKILFAAVYPAIATEPKELTEDCSRTLEKLMTVL